MKPQSLKIGAARFRIRPWQPVRGLDGAVYMVPTVYIVPLTTASTMKPAVLDDLMSRLRERGYVAVVTAPVHPPERDCLMSMGFNVHEELIVLRHTLGSRLPKWRDLEGVRMRRGRRRDLAAVLQLDMAAFTPHWRLDAAGFHEARTAAPTNRWRVLQGARNLWNLMATKVAGYCVTGRANQEGFLQRLAVAQPRQGRGLGTALVADALWWLRRAGATSALVNTQIGNDSALRLYDRCGFDREPHRLSAMHRDLTLT